MTSCTYRGTDYNPSHKAGTQVAGAGVYRGINWMRHSAKPVAKLDKDLIWRGIKHKK